LKWRLPKFACYALANLFYRFGFYFTLATAAAISPFIYYILLDLVLTFTAFADDGITLF
jgi:hypothetical protein